MNKSRSLDTMNQIDEELEQLDFIELRKELEDYVNKLLIDGILCLDVCANKSMKSAILYNFIIHSQFDFLKYGRVIPSILENIINCEILRIPQHSHIDLNKYFTSGIINELDDDEYLHQSLVMMKA